MVWQASVEVRNWLEEAGLGTQLEALFFIRTFVDHALVPTDYEASAAWERLVVLSDATNGILDSSSIRTSFSTAELHRAAFASLFYQDPLVDLTRCDIDGIEDLVSSELRRGRLLLPFRFGRLLYDRFNDSVADTRTEHLEPDESITLLEGTPQGVYQAGPLVSGPLGLIRSASVRWTPPSSSLPLWHCSDTGCRALHNVILRPVEVPAVRAIETLQRALKDRYGPPSNWEPATRSLHRRGRWLSGRPFHDLLPALAEALSEEERDTLFMRLLASESGRTLRATLVATRGREAGSGSPGDIAAWTSDAERLQLLALLEDEVLVRALDRAVFDGTIRIGAAELRRPVIRPPSLHSADRDTEISSLGTRADHDSPLVNFQSVVWRVYETHGLLEELGWRVRRRSGSPERSALADYVRSTDLRDTVTELVLSSMPVTLAVARELWLDPDDRTKSGVLADRILWKLGFGPSRFEASLALLHGRVANFNDTLFRIGRIASEIDREAIRSAGANLFVSVEEFIERVTAFAVWLLASDHLVASKFSYRHEDGLQRVAEVLGGSLSVGTETFRWNTEGGNALGALLVYLNHAHRWMAGLRSADRDAIARPTEDLPHYADSIDRPFPFRHLALWADLPSYALDGFVDGFGAMVTQVSQANVSAVRNGLDHMRSEDDFPTMDAMLLCATRLREAVEQADARRFYPKSFWLKARRSDRFGRIEYTMADYLSREHILNGPSSVLGLPAITFSHPLLIPPGDFLGAFGGTLRFNLGASGSYADYWASYPRRRRIPSPHREDSTALGPTSEGPASLTRGESGTIASS